MARRLEEITNDIERLTSGKKKGFQTYPIDIANIVKDYEKYNTLPQKNTKEYNSLIKLIELYTEYLRADKKTGSIGRRQDAVYQGTEEDTEKAIKIILGEDGERAMHDTTAIEKDKKLRINTRMYDIIGTALSLAGTTLIWQYSKEIDAIRNYKELMDLIKDMLPIAAGGASILGGFYSFIKAQEKYNEFTKRYNHLRNEVIPSLVEERFNIFLKRLHKK